MRRPLFGVIAPHPPIMVEQVGAERAEATQASSAAMLRAGAGLRSFAPETIVLISPHAPYSSAFVAVDDAPEFRGSLSEFGDVRVARYSGDPDLARCIVASLEASAIPAAARSTVVEMRSGWLDHGTLVPLSFLDPSGTYRLVVISLSSLAYKEHRDIGRAVAEAADGLCRRIAFIASGDLSHRLTVDAPAGFSPKARLLDATIVGLVEQGRFESLAQVDPLLIEDGGECGLRSIIALGGYCCDDPAPTRVLAYEGPWGVGYLTALVGREALEADDASGATPANGRKGGAAGSRESQIVRLARHAIGECLGRYAAATSLATLTDALYPDRAGVFVSLHIAGALRGCIGTISPCHPTLPDEVRSNAVQAAFEDSRFEPLSTEEFDELEISVDVLHPPEPCEFTDLDPASFGVIVTSDGRRGLLLPDLEGVDDPETQVSIAMSKAGIAAGERVKLQRFRVERYT